MRIFKYQIKVGDQFVQMPYGSNILHVGMQGTTITIWAMVEEKNSLVNRDITVVGTGWELPKEAVNWKYIGTVQTDGGFVWHVFER